MQVFMDKKWRRWLLVAMGVLIFSAAGCGETDTGGDNGSDAPVVPPLYTFVPNFGEIGNTETAASADEPFVDLMIKRPSVENSDVFSQAECLIDNYAYASFQVGFWNLALTVTLAVPVWSFAEAFHHDPVRREDGSWVWSYSATILGVLHTAELHGAFVDDKVHWNMFITKQGFFEDFLWYSGISNLPATTGTWTIKKSPEDPYDWIRIEWSREASNETWQVQYMNVHEADSNFGGYIQHGVTLGEPYNAFYDIYCGEQDNLVEIDASRANNVGRVRNPAHFEDEDWHYWDANHCDSVAVEP